MMWVANRHAPILHATEHTACATIIAGRLDVTASSGAHRAADYDHHCVRLI
jgi:hypothetical protein